MCETVLLLFRIKLDIPSKTEPSGDGVAGDVNGLSGDEGEGIECRSVRAVVAAAFAMAPEDEEEALPMSGIRPTENLDPAEPREARDPGRKGEERLGICCGVDPGW
jgi:hypothetical protein